MSCISRSSRPIGAVAGLLWVAVAAAGAPAEPAKQGQCPPRTAPAAEVSGETGWPIYRANASLQGVADGPIPDAPVQRWRFETEGPVRSSPVIDKGAVYIGSDDGRVYAIDLNTGKRRWSFQAESSIESPPALSAGLVFAGSLDGRLYCLDARTGCRKWTYVNV